MQITEGFFFSLTKIFDRNVKTTLQSKNSEERRAFAGQLDIHFKPVHGSQLQH